MANVDPIAFNLFGREVRWYGILIGVGMLLAIFIVYRRCEKYHHIKQDKLLNILVVSLPVALIGTRAYYVIFNWNYYICHTGEIFDVTRGGLAIHGGLIFGILAGFIMCKVQKISFLNALDLCVPAIALAQAIGRWGNFFNGEAHGGETNLPWAITVDEVKVHPTFLYESIWCLMLFVVLIILDNKPHFYGKIGCLYGILYSVERIFVEQLRTDSLMIGPFKQAQVISLVVIIVCSVAYVYLYRKSKKQVVR